MSKSTRQKSLLAELRSDDEDASKKEFIFFAPNKPRNLKRSFKRPQSIPGLTPVVNNQWKVEKRSRRKSQFNESLVQRLMSPDLLKRSYMICHTRDYASDAFEYLVSTEEQQLVTPRIPSITRAGVINWLMTINGADGNPATVQTAVWYLDSVLAIESIRLDNLQLLAIACYWVANKLHGPVRSAYNLVKCSYRVFTVQDLVRAEMAVLNRLKFPTQPVVPQEFITYLAWWCDESQPGQIEVAATFLCMSGLMVNECLCNHCPSVIGAAAVRNALLLLGKKYLIPHLRNCPVFKLAEKKASSMAGTCSLLRRAVRTVANPQFEYKTLLDHYGTSPHYIAQRIISAANELLLGCEEHGVYKHFESLEDESAKSLKATECL